MNGFATQLSEADKRNVSAWFASQAAKPQFAKSKDTSSSGNGSGAPAFPKNRSRRAQAAMVRRVRASPCSIRGSRASMPNTPKTTLKNFREGVRRNNAPMQQIAARLSDAEMKAVADFAQGLRR